MTLTYKGQHKNGRKDRPYRKECEKIMKCLLIEGGMEKEGKEEEK